MNYLWSFYLFKDVFCTLFTSALTTKTEFLRSLLSTHTRLFAAQHQSHPRLLNGKPALHTVPSWVP